MHAITWVPQLIFVGVKVLLFARLAKDVGQEGPRTDPHHVQLVPRQMHLRHGSKYNCCLKDLSSGEILRSLLVYLGSSKD